MYCVKFTITPTSAMTFRILPGSILNIATYPFVPPTTLSGFLRRVGMLSAGLPIPETKINKDNPPFYALPTDYIALGAYPPVSSWRSVHKTYRKGNREFSHDGFSRLFSDKKTDLQLHTWEYFITEELIGYVVSESLKGLKDFAQLENYGCKIGKEGFAIVTDVSSPIRMETKTIKAQPSTIVPMEALLQSNNFVGSCDIYNLYRYQWQNSGNDQPSFFSEQPSNIEGFIPLVVAYYEYEYQYKPTLDYYTDGEIFIPMSLVNLLKGE